MQLMRVCKGSGKALFELSLGADPGASPTPDQVTHFVILPFVHIVKGTVQDFSFSRIAAIIKEDHNRNLPIADAARQLSAGHLESAVSYQDDWSQAGVGEGGS